MNEHAGPACALSGLIVGLFAVLLHDKIPPPTQPKSPTREITATSKPLNAFTSDIPELIQRPSPKPVVAPLAGDGQMIVKKTLAAPAVVLEEARPKRPEPFVPRAAEAAVRVEPPAKPLTPAQRPPFAIAGPGESLADVAVRLYGSRDAAESLWKANRDQVERVDSTLAGGTLLRTP